MGIIPSKVQSELFVIVLLDLNDLFQCLLRASVGLPSLHLQTTLQNLERRLYFLTDAVQLQVISNSSHTIILALELTVRAHDNFCLCHIFMQIVTLLRISPKFLLLYNHPEAKVFSINFSNFDCTISSDRKWNPGPVL